MNANSIFMATSYSSAIPAVDAVELHRRPVHPSQLLFGSTDRETGLLGASSDWSALRRRAHSSREAGADLYCHC